MAARSPITSIARWTARLLIWVSSVGTSAMRSATVSTVFSSSAAGTARLAKPLAAASVPLIASPVRYISIAVRMPIRNGWNWLSGGLMSRVGG